MKSAAKAADLRQVETWLKWRQPVPTPSPMMHIGDLASHEAKTSVPRLQILIGERKRRVDLVKLGFQMFVDQQQGLERRAHAAVT